MRVKDDSVELDLRAEMMAGLSRLNVWHLAKTGKELVVTSGSEHIKHSVKRSAHYRGDAIDVRNWYLDKSIGLNTWAALIQEELGEDFVVINEVTHFHIHWSPVYHG